jgi:hypothetical protein
MIRLFTTVYPDFNPDRRHEFDECVRRNLENSAIGGVFILAEGSSAGRLPDHGRLHVRNVLKRPSYDDFFDWVNDVSAPDDVSVIANADIYFDRTIGCIVHFLGSKDCYSLSRWDVLPNGRSRLFDRADSQDAWIFRGPILERVDGSFPLGVPRCDNRICHELVEAGYRISNPAFSIRIHHLHSGKRSEYGDAGADFIQPPYRYVFPANIRPFPLVLLHNLLHPRRTIPWRPDVRCLNPVPHLKRSRVRLGRLRRLISWRFRA